MQSGVCEDGPQDLIWGRTYLDSEKGHLKPQHGVLHPALVNEELEGQDAGAGRSLDPSAHL